MKKHVLFLLFTLSLLSASLSGTAYASDCSDESKYPEIGLSELKAAIKKKAVFLLDANGKNTYEKNHIANAVHFGSNEDKLKEILPKDKNALIVAYCGGPMCTAWEDAAEAACEQGYTNIKHFKDGIKGWMEARR